VIPVLKEFFVKQFRLGSETGPLFLSGTGSPEGAVTAPVGSVFTRTDGGTDTTIYRKESGTGNTGWIAVSNAGGGGGGAPTGAQYVTLATDATLTGERVLTAGKDITLTDGGAGNALTVASVVSSQIFGKIVTSTATGTQADFNPTNWDAAEPNKATIIEWAGTAPALISGLAGGVAGRVAVIRNRSAEQCMVLQHEASGSLAANRFNFVDAGRVHAVIFPGDSLALLWDGVDQRWECMDAHPVYDRAGWIKTAQVPGTGTAPISLGIAHTTASAGTISTPTIANTNYKTSQRRTSGATGTTAGVQSGTRNAIQTIWRGNAAGRGGFLLRYVWSYEALPAAANTTFVGLLSSTAVAANADSSTLLNAVGWGRDPADSANLRSITNDNAGVATRVDLGANFAENLTSVFHGMLFCIPNGTGITQITWRADDLTIAPDVRFLSTDLPQNTVFLAHYAYIGNRAAAASYQINWSLIEEYRPQ
jgi:hypothetical protein